MMSWTVQTLVSVTVLLALVMAVRQIVAKAFGARLAYMLWALPAIRMVLPTLPGHRQLFMPVLRVGAEDHALTTSVGLVPAEAGIDPFVLPPAVAQAPIAHAVDWPMLLLAVWAAGAVLFFAWQMIRYRLFVVRALNGATLLSVEAGIEVWASPRVAGPVAAGFLKRRIFLPLDFLTRFSSDERRQALLHEGAHHDRRDILANLGALAVLAAHWWNPIAHIAYRAFRSDQELACDATVLAGASPQERYSYSSALAKAGGARMPTAACALDNATEIKRRLKMIKRGRITLGRRAAGLLIATSAIAGGLVATASGSYAASVAEKIAPPAPPAAPAPPADLPPLPPLPAAPKGPHRTTVVHLKGKDGVTTTTASRDADTPLTREQERAIADADRAAEQASRAAERAGQQAAEAGRRAAEAGRRAADLQTRRMMIVDHGETARVAMEEARNGMVKRCADAGMPVKPGEQDWGVLATCDKSVIIAALESARAEIASSHDMADAERARATASIDTTIARMKAQQRR